jgi:serine/threonine-protein kinase RsbW/stage II sporulation protein AB (anti-sigma F factor)
MLDGRWERDAIALPENVGPLRNGVVAFAAAHGAGADVQGDVALAVSEALTNAVVHAFASGAPGTMRLLARAADGVLHVSVVDDGAGMSARTDSPGLGVGLTVMISISSSCELRPGPEGRGTEVRFTFDGLRDAPGSPG